MTPDQQDASNFLKDINLDVSIVLGSKQVPLKELMSLKSGMIVELESLITEPVDILVNGVIVAKGELVEVENNFGVKVTAILPEAKRVIKGDKK